MKEHQRCFRRMGGQLRGAALGAGNYPMLRPRSRFEGAYGFTGGLTVPPTTCAVVWTVTRAAATSPCRKSSNAVSLLGVMA
jgi:hypothetical protein